MRGGEDLCFGGYKYAPYFVIDSYTLYGSKHFYEWTPTRHLE